MTPPDASAWSPVGAACEGHSARPNPGQSACNPMMRPESGPDLAVAYVSPGWAAEDYPNGVIPYVVDMAHALRRAGQKSFVFPWICGPDAPDWVYDLVPRSAPRGLADRVVDNVLYRLGNSTLLHRRRYCRAIAGATLSAVAEHGANLLEVEEAFGWSHLLRGRIGIPVVVRLHGPWFLNAPADGVADSAAYRRRVRDERRSIALADGVSSPSLDTLERTRAFYGLPLADAVVIPPPAPVVAPDRRWRAEACEPNTLLFIGRFDRHKGADVLLDAFARVARKYPAARLKFVGPDQAKMVDTDGKRWSLPEYAADRFPDAVADGRFEWLGPQPKSALQDLRRGASVTIVASRYETFGLTVTEALVQGCPLIATRTGAIPENVRDGETGLLCRPDDPDDLAAAMGRLLEDPSLAARLGGRAGDDAARRYHPDAIAAEMSVFYRDVIGGRKGVPTPAS